MKDYNKLETILEDANSAKNKLASIADRLMEAGFEEKANSCMTLVYKIEAWQNSK